MPTTPANPAAARRRGGFTLAEMLVVIGIILLVLAIAVPAFTAIIGSRSKEAAQNLIAASLVRARTEAIRRGTPCGVLFYVDPDTQQSALALVQFGASGEPDTYNENHPFVRGAEYQGGSTNPLTAPAYPDADDEPAMTADRVVVLSADGLGGAAADDPTTPFHENVYPPKYAAFNGRPIVLVVQHSGVDTDLSTLANDNPGLSNPGDSANEPGPNSSATAFVNSLNPASADTAYWNASDDQSGEIEIIGGLDTVRIPAGVGVQVIRKQTLQSGTSGVAAAVEVDANGNRSLNDRYVRTGLIAFAADGQVIQTNWSISANTRLGTLMGLAAVKNASGVPLLLQYNASAFGPLESEIGVVVYDEDKFKNAAADGTATQWQSDTVTTLATPQTIDDFKTTEGDYAFLFPYGARPQDLGGTAAQQQANEYAEERWLDANTTPLMVNRYSGILVEAQ